MEEASRCSMCGTAEWEWDEDRFAYEPVVTRCQGCYLKDITGEDTHNQPGVSVVLVPAGSVTTEVRQRMELLQEQVAAEKDGGWA